MINAVNHNPIGMTDKVVAELYWSNVQLQATRTDNLNLAIFN